MCGMRVLRNLPHVGRKSYDWDESGQIVRAV